MSDKGLPVREPGLPGTGGAGLPEKVHPFVKKAEKGAAVGTEEGGREGGPKGVKKNCGNARSGLARGGKWDDGVRAEAGFRALFRATAPRPVHG